MVRPTVIAVVRDIKSMLGLKDNIYTQYDPKDDIKKRINELGELLGENNSIKEWVKVETEEVSEPDYELLTIPSMPDYKPIYKDVEVGSKVAPIYHHRKLNIKFTYLTMSKSGANAIINNIRAMTSNDGYSMKHDLEYHYTVGGFVTDLVSEINTLKNKRLENKFTLEEYIGKTFDDRVDLAYTFDADLNKAEVVIRETQLEVIGYIEDSTYDITTQYDEEYGQWTIDFTYTISYEKPVSLLVKYPIVVYNSLINGWFRRMNPKYKFRANGYRTGRIASAFEAVNKPELLRSRANGNYICIPDLDKPELPKQMDIYSRLLCILCIVDETDRTLLFNIRDIPNIEFREEVITFITKSEKESIGKMFQSLFYFELFENESKCYDKEITIDKDGNLRSTKPLDMTKTYRVTISALSNLISLDLKARNRINDYIFEESNNLVDGSVSFGGIMEIYLRLFNWVTNLEDDNTAMKYRKEWVHFGDKVLQNIRSGSGIDSYKVNSGYNHNPNAIWGSINSMWDNPKTKAVGQVIVMNSMFKEKNKN